MMYHVLSHSVQTLLLEFLQPKPNADFQSDEDAIYLSLIYSLC